MRVKMTRERWETLCRKDGFAPAQKYQLKDADIYICEKVMTGRMDAVEPVERQTHAKLMFMVARKKPSFALDITLSVIRWPLQQQRINIVRASAEAHLAQLVKIGPKFVERA